MIRTISDSIEVKASNDQQDNIKKTVFWNEVEIPTKPKGLPYFLPPK